MKRLINADLFGKLIQFTNCYIIKGDEVVKSDLWIRDGIILGGIALFFEEKIKADIVIDLNSNIIAPGLIDIQVNGAFGYDFSNTNQSIIESCQEVASRLPTAGVTAFCPTIITSHPLFYKKLISQFKNYRTKIGCAKVLGIHLEGPFISKTFAGMHPKEYIIEFGSDPIKTIRDVYGHDLSMVRLVTISPELPGSSEAISYLVSKNIIVSMGHTSVEYDAAKRAISTGVSFVTHIFNAMPSFHHREDHLFGCISMTEPYVHVGLIADKVHVSPAGMCLAECISPGRVVLVTDCNTAYGLADGSYTFGVQNIEVKAGTAYIAGTKCLAGATTSLLKCVENFWLEVTHNGFNEKDSQVISFGWCGIGRALAAASLKPAMVLKLYRNYSKTYEAKLNGYKVLKIGALSSGSDADFIIININQSSDNQKPFLKLLSTWIDGVPVYNAPDHEIHIKIL